MKNLHLIILLIFLIVILSVSIVISTAAKPLKGEKQLEVVSNEAYLGSSSIERNFKEEKVNDDTKIAYVTFDDGPSPNVTPKILKILKEYNIKATFFMLGGSVKKYPSIAKQVYSEGHIIGNHTYSHSWSLFKSLYKFQVEVFTTNKIIEKTIGYKPELLRTPYGKKIPKHYRDFLNKQGIKLYYWNIDSKDSRRRNIPAKVIYNSVAWSLKGKKEVMILMHDGGGHGQTVAALPGIIETLQKQGYEIRPITPDTKTRVNFDWNL